MRPLLLRRCLHKSNRSRCYHSSFDNGENLLGLGIADAIIKRTSQTGKSTVRPTSAVLKYAKTETDSLEAAKQLSADAVLEGTTQRVGDRLRVTVIY